MLVGLDTSCIINLLSREESPDADLLGVIRCGLDGRARLLVTPVVDVELPDLGDGEEGHAPSRRFIRQSLAQFPSPPITPAREAERDAAARQLLGHLWPGVQPGSRKHSNSLRDCTHLASLRLCGGDAFVTKDEELVRKARARGADLGVAVLTPTELLARLTPAEPQATSSWTPTVRKAQDDDRGDIRALLEPIRSTYDDFDGWLSSALGNKEMWVGVLDRRIGAVSVWAPKVGTTTVKLSTFFVGEEFTGRGLGPHLLFHQLRLWVERRFSKVFVTVSTERLDALSFFLTYGFRIEGSAARRYKSDAVEFVLGKHLVFEVIDDDGLGTFLGGFGAQVFGLPDSAAVRGGSSWFLPPIFGSLRASRDAAGAVRGVEVVADDGAVTRAFTLGRFEELIYPARLATSGRRAFLIPIQPLWADAMVQVPRAQGSLFASSDKLALRSDNAYYLHPRYLDEEVEGCPVLFYVSQPDGMIAGFARIIERDIAEPEDLYLKYDRLGIYGLDHIRQHVKRDGRHAGCAMAIRFAWWVPLTAPVGLERLRREFGLEAPQTITAIEYSVYENILHAGGVSW